MDSLQGQLLISSGGLYDPNFRHTVVLIGRHTADGALGVILNRMQDVAAAAALPDLADFVAEDERLFVGGPVQPDGAVLLAEFEDREAADLLVFDSIGFVTGEASPELARSIRRARVFLGYSGWGPGQLEAEMAADSWLVEPARVDDVFTAAPDLLWSRVLERKGPQFRRLSRMPYDPSMN